MIFFKTAVAIVFLFSISTLITGCSFLIPSEVNNAVTEVDSINNELPVWLMLEYRQEGSQGIQEIIQKTADRNEFIHEINIEENRQPSSDSTPKQIDRSRSPYEPGTIADLIWQQKKADGLFDD